MKTIQVPIFNEFDNLNFIGFVNVKIKNKPNTADYNKITHKLPGLPQGYCKEFYDIARDEKPIEIIRFYDIRQNTKKLKGYFITVKKQ